MRTLKNMPFPIAALLPCARHSKTVNNTGMVRVEPCRVDCFAFALRYVSCRVCKGLVRVAWAVLFRVSRRFVFFRFV